MIGTDSAQQRAATPMARCTALLILLLASSASHAAEPGSAEAEAALAAMGMERAVVTSGPDAMEILVRHDTVRRPVLVMVPGSACMPALMLVEGNDGFGNISSVMPPSAASQREMGVHLALLERRNLSSFRHVYSKEETAQLASLDMHVCTERNGAVTLSQRRDDVLAQLAYLRRQPWAGPILLVGVSEGTDVATAVAAEHSSNVHALLLIVGAGMSQFFDFVHQARAAGDNASATQVLVTLDAFLSGNPPADYQGHGPARWQSFAIAQTNLDSLMGSTAPVFIVHGSADTSVPIASVDALVVEVMRRQPARALHYMVVDGGGHSLWSVLADPPARIYPPFVRWALEPPQGRTFSNVGVGSAP
ncbi:alpha/beta hydrolase family protein [Pseudoxanthomonas kaohsiungensis]|uniref:Alpha/beta hydrolase family protein n=1 Tax=Pseudoxanthomonas kaohsiungensis TaxID=283923 RepID=A0ABW3LWV7_9GAMM|nr:alpha/beta hydrolase [Pseudoxanthomonas kaohsiungensis]KAF1704678.1 hypothetical protein CSC66_03645 [Pseudoxanthomonas kaohsiungensis]